MASNRVALDVKAAVIYENGGPEVLRYEDIAPSTRAFTQ
jgi:hypothetical protein